ncbi:MAG: hypothetical protein GXY53_00515 [Desulfobulbus sp.]|nr:hypothetical protein [Desulfobulbus sp.]
MKKVRPVHFLILTAFVLLSVGFSLTTWKMFEFRGRHHEIISNARHEQTLAGSGMYDEHVIVFFGDSQIDLWWMAPSFGALPIVNRGVSGDWAGKAVHRFDRDVLSLKPKLLIMLIGTNDIGNGRTVEEVVADIDDMLGRAAEQNIPILLCSVLPVRGVYLENHPVEVLLRLNNGLKALSQKYNAGYVDFYSHLAGADGLLKKEYTSDGLHPSRLGYMEMTRVLLPHLLRDAALFYQP